MKLIWHKFKLLLTQLNSYLPSLGDGKWPIILGILFGVSFGLKSGLFIFLCMSLVDLILLWHLTTNAKPLIRKLESFLLQADYLVQSTLTCFCGFHNINYSKLQCNGYNTLLNNYNFMKVIEEAYNEEQINAETFLEIEEKFTSYISYRETVEDIIENTIPCRIHYRERDDGHLTFDPLEIPSKPFGYSLGPFIW